MRLAAFAGSLLGATLAMTACSNSPQRVGGAAAPVTDSPAATTAATTAAPSASAGPTSSAPASPSTTPSTSSAPPIPASIPARALVNSQDAHTSYLKRRDTASKPHKFCPGTTYPSAERAAISATVGMDYYTSYHKPGSGYVPDDLVENTVTVYRGDGASAFLDDLAAAVRACPSNTVNSRRYTFKSKGSLRLGDGSLLVELSTPAYLEDGSSAGGGTHYTYIAAIRVGDAVTMVETKGWEAYGSERANVETLAKAAAKHLTDWR
jgi:hypothetical protein